MMELLKSQMITIAFFLIIINMSSSILGIAAEPTIIQMDDGQQPIGSLASLAMAEGTLCTIRVKKVGHING
jgi:hypothetical protein